MKMVKNKNIHKHWDEHMVIAVLIVSAICLLILLASFISVTGKASYSGLATSESVLEMINENSLLVSGSGRMKCSYACSNQDAYSLLSYADEVQVENSAVFRGDYSCLCAYD